LGQIKPNYPDAAKVEVINASGTFALLAASEIFSAAFSACGQEQKVLRRSQSPRNSQRARAMRPDNIAGGINASRSRFVTFAICLGLDRLVVGQELNTLLRERFWRAESRYSGAKR
jgi:hypothetical protein